MQVERLPQHPPLCTRPLTHAPNTQTARAIDDAHQAAQFLDSLS